MLEVEAFECEAYCAVGRLVLDVDLALQGYQHDSMKQGNG